MRLPCSYNRAKAQLYSLSIELLRDEEQGKIAIRWDALYVQIIILRPLKKSTSMTIESEYAEALERGDFWAFISKHGCQNFSRETGEKIPEEALKNDYFFKYAEIYNALLG